MNDGKNKLELASLRQKLDGKSGKRYWRSLEEVADTPEFRKFLDDEFIAGASHWDESLSRRSLLKVMGASLALAGLASCKRKVDETIVPYVQQPEGWVAGKPLYYATAMTHSGYAQGVIAESHEGRPTKLEGNPDQSASLGGSDVFVQAELLTMYDPDRSRLVKFGDDIKDWDSFVAAIRPRLEGKRTNGSGLRILTETITSPSVVAQIQTLKKAYPGSKWHKYDPINRDNVRAGLASATGKEVLPYYDFSTASVIVSLDSDFLYEEPGHLRYARDFAAGRRVRAGTTSMNRLYVFESSSSITGSVADHRWAMKPSMIVGAAAAIATALGVNTNVATLAGSDAWAAAIAKDLQANKGTSIVLAGTNQPPAVHALVHSINVALGNIDKTVKYIPPVEADADGTIADLATDMDSGAVDTLIILGGNPAYTAPSDLNFDTKLEKFLKTNNGTEFTNLSVHLGLHEDETSFLTHWHLPQTHFLEEWGDARGYDGQVAVIQPLIEPLYGGKSMLEILAMLTSDPIRKDYDLVRRYWRGLNLAGDFEPFWQSCVEKGVIPTPANFNPYPATASTPAGEAAPAATTGSGFEIVFKPDPNIWDGRYSNNGWMQELAKPLTKLTWDNAAIISPASAKKLSVENGDYIIVATGTRSLTVPVFLLPGQPDDSITLHFGYGRTKAGQVGTSTEENKVGVNVYALRTSDAPYFATGVTVTKSDGNYELVATHTHQTIDSRTVGNFGVHLHPEVVGHPEHDHDEDHPVSGEEANEDIDNRKLIRTATLDEFKTDPLFAKKLDESYGKTLTLYPGYDNIYKQNFAWAMSIDMQSCIGCNACVIACQAENNIPVVGKDQVSRGREMHWIRIDTYFEGDENAPTATYHQPIPCMQCENAPCELVCPVGATVHDNEGLNDMVYNRCVGTRYCSNNCPYKVRRFNFYQFVDRDTESLKLMRNPDVTVRSRGVMEKCTYCVQRLTETRIEMEKIEVRLEEQATKYPDEADEVKQKSIDERQKLLDSLQTACQQACPSQAIVFGNKNPIKEPKAAIDPTYVSPVMVLKSQPHDYSLLADLTTNPRTTYLVRVTNPNPEIEKA